MRFVRKAHDKVAETHKPVRKAHADDDNVRQTHETDENVAKANTEEGDDTVTEEVDDYEIIDERSIKPEESK